MNFDIIFRDAEPYGPKYCSEIENLGDNLDGKNSEEQCKLFKEFSSNFSILPSLWIYWFKTECNKNGIETPAFTRPDLNQLFGIPEQPVLTPKTFSLGNRFVIADARRPMTFLIPEPSVRKKQLGNVVDKFESIKCMTFANFDCDELIFDKKKLHDTLNMEYHKLKKKHLYIDYNENQLQNTFKNIDAPHHDEIKYLKDMLSFPHSGISMLEKIYSSCYSNKFSTSPKAFALIKTKKSENLYEMLKIIERNEELWIKYLKETENSEFILNSCEYRLGKNPENKDFWSCYLQYLKECDNIEKVLKTYSRYCRLFLNDENMLEKYYKEIDECELNFRLKWWSDYMTLFHRSNSTEVCDEKMRQILTKHYTLSKKWKMLENDFDSKFDKFCGIIRHREFMLNGVTDTVIEDDKNPNLPTSMEPAIRQYFQFPKITMDHIILSASPEIQIKLQLTCKYFYQKIDTVVCHRLSIQNYSPPTFTEHSLFTCNKDIEKINLKKYCLSNFLQIWPPALFTNSLSKILSNIKSCNLRFLMIHSQNISLNEWEFLTISNTLEDVQIDKCVIKDGENIVPFEKIIGELPNVTMFKCNPKDDEIYTTKTATNLLNLTREQKFQLFNITMISEKLGFESIPVLGSFITKNASRTATFNFAFKTGANAEFRENFKASIKQIIDERNQNQGENIRVLFTHF